ncbi:MAG: MFS transporter [Candidatus Brocadiae bacterium]|nr:MFS transporter [Candidatus Brocadiia bacterium]
MDDGTHANVRWLTLAAWLTILVFAATTTVPSVSLEHIGTDLQIGFGLRGVLSTARAVVLALATFLTGYLADRYGKRWFLAGGMFVVALALVGVWRSSDYAGLMGGMVLGAVGLGAVEALASPLVADLHPRNVPTQMNVLHGFFPAGIAAFSPLAGWALDAGMHWRTLFGLAAVLPVLVGVMFAMGRYPTSGGGSRRAPLAVRRILSNRTFWLLAAAMALTAGSEGALLFWSPNFLQSEYQVAALVGGGGLTAFCVTMAVGRFGTGAAVRVVPLHRLMVALAFLCAVATLFLVVVGHLWVSIASLALAGVSVACFWPSILSLATSRIAAGSATLLAMLAVAGIVGWGLLPAVIGVLGDWFGLRVGLGLVPAAMVAAGLVLMAVPRGHGGPDAEAGTDAAVRAAS